MELTKEKILRYFDDKDYEYFKNSVGIITNNWDKALSFFDNLFKEHGEAVYRRSKYGLELYYNGKDYLWIKPNEYSRGHKFGEIYIDTDISEEIFHNIVLPICAYVPRDKVHII